MCACERFLPLFPFFPHPKARRKLHIAMIKYEAARAPRNESRTTRERPRAHACTQTRRKKGKKGWIEFFNANCIPRASGNISESRARAGSTSALASSPRRSRVSHQLETSARVRKMPPLDTSMSGEREMCFPFLFFFLPFCPSLSLSLSQSLHSVPRTIDVSLKRAFEINIVLSVKQTKTALRCSLQNK